MRKTFVAFIASIVLCLVAVMVPRAHAQEPAQPVALHEVPVLVSADNGATFWAPPCASGLVALVVVGYAGPGPAVVRVNGGAPMTFYPGGSTEVPICSDNPAGSVKTLCVWCNSWPSPEYSAEQRVWAFVHYGLRPPVVLPITGIPR